MGLSFRQETCSGCKACELVCSLQNLNVVNPSKALLGVHGKFPVPGKYTMDLCDQCGDCAAACPNEAITLKAGAYGIDRDRCDGCMACVDACPRHLVKIGDDNLPYKCINCRQCVEVCPRDALSFN